MADGQTTFVLVHGAFHGGWCWARVADRLRVRGHRVFTPTCTGLGDRAHLMSGDISLDMFTRDVAAVIEMEELEDVVLVGHSFGGNPTSGVADRMPERIRHLVYLDALVVQRGQTAFTGLSDDIVASRRRAARESSGGMSVPVPPPSVFGVPDGPDADWLRRRLTPHPIGTYETPLGLDRPVGNGLPRTYIVCTAPIYEPLQPSRDWVRAQPDWDWRELATGHDAMVTAPEALTGMLLDIAGAA